MAIDINRPTKPGPPVRASHLLRSPIFTTVAVLCLALGIGAHTAIFTLVDAALLRMLPVAGAASLVVVRNAGPGGGRGASFSYPQFVYLPRPSPASTSLGGVRSANASKSAAPTVKSWE